MKEGWELIYSLYFCYDIFFGIAGSDNEFTKTEVEIEKWSWVFEHGFTYFSIKWLLILICAQTLHTHRHKSY